jgi:hypothetical protein
VSVFLAIINIHELDILSFFMEHIWQETKVQKSVSFLLGKGLISLFQIQHSGQRDDFHLEVNHFNRYLVHKWFLSFDQIFVNQILNSLLFLLNPQTNLLYFFEAVT